MNVAVIGCGYWGPNLVRNLTALPEIDRVVCCDSKQAKLDRIKALHPHAETTGDYHKVVADPEIGACVIATPTVTHFSIAKDCLTAGKHVLVEKPMAGTSDQCRELVRLARLTDRVLMVGHTFEYSVAVNKARDIIRSGELGDILYLSLQRLNLGPYRSDVDVVWDLAAHDVSIARFLLEDEPIGVNAQGKAFLRSDNADVATAVLHFPDATVAFLHDSWLDPHKVRKSVVVGSRKMLVYDDIEVNEKLKIFDKGIDAPSNYDTYGEFPFSYRYGDILSPRIEDQEPLRVQCQHFVDCIRDGSVPRSDGESGRQVVRVLEAMSKSIRHQGAYITLSETGDEASTKPEWASPPV